MSFALGPGAAATESDDGMVLLHEGTGRYWMLNPTGAAVVRLLQVGRETADVVEALGARFAQDPARGVTSDTTLLRQVTPQPMVSAVTGVLTLGAVMVMMGGLDPLLLGVTVGVVAVVSGVITTAMPRISRATLRAQASVGAMGSVLERALGAFRTVKASGAEERETAVVRQSADEAWRNGIEAAKWQCGVRAVVRSAGFFPQGYRFCPVSGSNGGSQALRARTGQKRHAMDPWLIWLIVAAVLAVAEIFTLTAALGLLSAAALVTAGSAAVGMPLPLQFLVFTIVATVTVLFVRPIALRHVLRPQVARFGVDALVGKAAYVVSEVTGLGGRVRIDGEEWTARAYDETLVIPPGKTVDVMEISGATAIVYPRD